MANMASVAYAIEGPQETLDIIKEAINKAVNDKDDKRYEEYITCLNLGFTEEEIEKSRLGGLITEEAEIRDSAIRFWTEERWGLQDFDELLMQKFPDIKVYWVVEESGMEIYCTNDKDGKYFPDRYWVDACIDGEYQSEYFIQKKSAFQWLANITQGRVKSSDDIDAFNSDYEDSDASEDNFIYIHEFEIIDD